MKKMKKKIVFICGKCASTFAYGVRSVRLTYLTANFQFHLISFILKVCMCLYMEHGPNHSSVICMLYSIITFENRRKKNMIDIRLGGMAFVIAN